MKTVKRWLAIHRKKVAKAIDAGKPLQRCDCCGGYLPPYEVWQELRQSDRGSECDGTVTSHGNCRSFAEAMP